MKRLLVLACLVAISPWLASSDTGRVGKPALEIKANHWIHGRGQSLRSLKGKVVVLDFWATWCGPCVQSMPHIQQIHERYAGKGVQVVAITSEHGTDVEEFLKGKPFTYLVAAESETPQTYEVRGIPHALVLNREGVVVWEGHPEQGLDEAIESALK